MTINEALFAVLGYCGLTGFYVIASIFFRQKKQRLEYLPGFRGGVRADGRHLIHDKHDGKPCQACIYVLEIKNGYTPQSTPQVAHSPPRGRGGVSPRLPDPGRKERI